MGFFGLFGGGNLSDRRIDKSAKLAANPFAQPDVRMREMQRLLADGSPTALRGVLKRFTANASGHIADEDEKQWLENALVETGEEALDPLRAFIKSEENLTYALHAYERIAGGEEAVRFYLEAMTAYGPDDHRSSEAKLQMVHALAEHLDDPRVLSGLLPFVLDHADEVRTAVLDLIDTAADRGLLSPEHLAALAEPFASLVCDGTVGPRVQRRAVELLEKRTWAVGGEVAELSTLINDVYFLDKKRFVRKRAKK